MNCNRFRRTGEYRINSNNGVLRGHFFVRHLNGTVVVEHSLKMISGLEPGEIKQTAEGLSKIPGDDDAVREFFYIVRTGHSRLEEHTNGRSFAGQLAGHICQLIEPIKDDSSIAMTVWVKADVFL